MPTVALTGVPATLPEKGATIGAAATADPALGLAAVEFRLGTRAVCRDTTPPYSCAILPTGAEVGKQAVQATAVDAAARSAVATASTTVAKFAVKAMTIKVKNGKAKGKLVRSLTGKLSLNPRVTKRQGCATGTATLTVLKNGRRLIGLQQVPLKRDCTFALKLTVAKSAKHAFKVTAKVMNGVLHPTSGAVSPLSKAQLARRPVRDRPVIESHDPRTDTTIVVRAAQAVTLRTIVRRSKVPHRVAYARHGKRVTLTIRGAYRAPELRPIWAWRIIEGMTRRHLTPIAHHI